MNNNETISKIGIVRKYVKWGYDMRQDRIFTSLLAWTLLLSGCAGIGTQVGVISTEKVVDIKEDNLDEITIELELEESSGYVSWTGECSTEEGLAALQTIYNTADTIETTVRDLGLKCDE